MPPSSDEKCVRISAEDMEKFRDLGKAPNNVRLLDFLRRKLRVLRMENDEADGIYLTRNQGKILMLVELLKLLGVEEEQ